MEEKVKKTSKKNSKIISKIFNFIFTFIKSLIIIIITLAFCLTLFIAYKAKPFYDTLERNAKTAISQSDYSDFRINTATHIYNSDKEIIASFTPNGKLTYLKSEEIPEYVKQAFIAVEDRNYYEHNGFDTKGIIRVCFQYFQTDGEEKHGASTITQQLIKNIYLSPEVTIERKINEIFYAVELEKKYTKDEILEFYINDIFYGNNCYGIETASECYFNKSVDELSLSQIAFLCAIPNSPSYYDPFKNFDNTITRRNKILNDMYECEFITKEELDNALNEVIKLERGESKVIFRNYETTYAMECAVEYLMQYEGFKFEYSWDTKEEYNNYIEKYNEKYNECKEKLYTEGYNIYTSLDKDAQEKLQQTLDDTLSFDEELQEDGTYALQGAMTCIDNETGKVIAIIGGRTQDSNNIYTLNRAFQGYRQPGSTMKPIAIYAPALQNGYHKNSSLLNISVTESHKKNVDINTLLGDPIQLSTAVEKSTNGAAVYLFNKIKINYGLSFLTKMKFSRLVPEDYTIAAGLGGLTIGTTTEEMAGAYHTLYNHGDYIDTTCIVSIVDKNGNDIYKEPTPKEVYTDNAADDMTDVLKGVLTRGTAYSLKWSSKTNTEAAGKTGTTDDYKDGWFCGYTPYYTISVWVGYDTPKTLTSLKGSSYPAIIWRDSMLQLIEGKEEKGFEKSKDYVEASIIYHGNADIILPESAYTTLLPGRDDSEELSPNYTVYDYRVDRTIGENVNTIISQINSLNKSSPTFTQDLDSLYSSGLALIDKIYGQRYTQEVTTKLNEAYNAKK